jgi:hypothetical protein
VLTLWFDPGRVKRDLIPNKEMGAPLEAGSNYRLVISPQWKDKEGRTLQSSFTKTFITTARDSTMPDPNQWNLVLPAAGTNEPLTIEFSESLDYVLLNACVTIEDENGIVKEGTIEVFDNERQLSFMGSAEWKKGNYYLVVENRLEDRCGNNLVRPFDRDVETTPTKGDVTSTYLRQFTIR